ncbi:unnamed protein product, partial [marine sediment metagenome]
MASRYLGSQGIFGSYTFYSKPILRIEGRYSWGKVDYEGGTWGGTPLRINNIDDYIWELRVLAGNDVELSEKSTIRVYTGIGYRYLNDDLSPFPGGYERESNYIYTPIGIETIPVLEKEFSLGMTLEYDYLWNGTQ